MIEIGKLVHMSTTKLIIGHHRWSTGLNIIALTILFFGYFLTTGTGLIESDELKATFRLSSLAVLIVNLLIDGVIKKKFIGSKARIRARNPQHPPPLHG